MRSSLLASAAATVLVLSGVPGVAAAADTDIDLDTPVVVSPITVVGTRTERAVDDVPATISVISAEQIERLLVTDIKDLIKFEPGVASRPPPPAFRPPCRVRAATAIPASPFGAWAATAS